MTSRKSAVQPKTISTSTRKSMRLAERSLPDHRPVSNETDLPINNTSANDKKNKNSTHKAFTTSNKLLREQHKKYVSDLKYKSKKVTGNDNQSDLERDMIRILLTRSKAINDNVVLKPNLEPSLNYSEVFLHLIEQKDIRHQISLTKRILNSRKTDLIKKMIGWPSPERSYFKKLLLRLSKKSDNDDYMKLMDSVFVSQRACVISKMKEWKTLNNVSHLFLYWSLDRSQPESQRDIKEQLKRNGSTEEIQQHYRKWQQQGFEAIVEKQRQSSAANPRMIDDDHDDMFAPPPPFTSFDTFISNQLTDKSLSSYISDYPSKAKFHLKAMIKNHAKDQDKFERIMFKILMTQRSILTAIMEFKPYPDEKPSLSCAERFLKLIEQKKSTVDKIQAIRRIFNSKNPFISLKMTEWPTEEESCFKQLLQQLSQASDKDDYLTLINSAFASQKAMVLLKMIDWKTHESTSYLYLFWNESQLNPKQKKRVEGHFQQTYCHPKVRAHYAKWTAFTNQADVQHKRPRSDSPTNEIPNRKRACLNKGDVQPTTTQNQRMPSTGTTDAKMDSIKTHESQDMMRVDATLPTQQTHSKKRPATANETTRNKRPCLKESDALAAAKQNQAEAATPIINKSPKLSSLPPRANTVPQSFIWLRDTAPNAMLAQTPVFSRPPVRSVPSSPFLLSSLNANASFSAIEKSATTSLLKPPPRAAAVPHKQQDPLTLTMLPPLPLPLPILLNTLSVSVSMTTKAGSTLSTRTTTPLEWSVLVSNRIPRHRS